MPPLMVATLARLRQLKIYSITSFVPPCNDKWNSSFGLAPYAVKISLHIVSSMVFISLYLFQLVHGNPSQWILLVVSP